MIYLIVSAFLVACLIVTLVCPGLYKISSQPGYVILIIITLAILGLNWLLYHNRQGVYAFSLVLWFFVVLLGYLSAADTYVLLIGADTEKNRAPVSFEKPENKKSSVIVYHPGGSGFPLKVNSMIADELSRSGVNVTLYTAGSGLKIDLKDIAAIGFSSPVYGGRPRPPMLNCINSFDLKGVKCFVDLTGSFGDAGPEMKAKTADEMRKLVEARGGEFIGYMKFSSLSGRLKEETGAFAGSILSNI